MTYSYEGINFGGGNPLAGKYGGYTTLPDAEKIKAFKEAYGPEKWQDAYLQDQAFDRLNALREQEGDSDYIRRQLLPVEEMLGRIGQQKQIFGFQSNLLGAGINAINKIPETMLAMRAIPLQEMAYQTRNVPNILGGYSPTSYGSLQYRLAGGRA